MKIRNFDYYWNCKIIRDVLKKQDEVSEPLQNFILTQHEKDVLTAFDDLIKFTKQSIVRNKWNIQATSVKKYTELIQDDEQLINYSLLLHDIAKDRGFPNPHPEYSYQIIHQFRNEIQEATHLSDSNWIILEWLIRYHDVLGNINTGERHPQHLSKILSMLPTEIQSRSLQLLALITLCDVQGTNKGMYLTDEKARFWLQLSDVKFRNELSQRFLFHRIKRWTGDLLTKAHPEQEKKVWESIQKNQRESLFHTFWGSQISHVVHGIYLFIELVGESTELLYLLLDEIALECQKHLPSQDEIQIVFHPFKPWIPEDKTVYLKYREGIIYNHLHFEIEQNTMKVKSSR